ncbi:hypothetical protein D3C87_1026890 [compost metagenome]
MALDLGDRRLVLRAGEARAPGTGGREGGDGGRIRFEPGQGFFQAAQGFAFAGFGRVGETRADNPARAVPEGEDDVVPGHVEVRKAEVVLGDGRKGFEQAAQVVGEGADGASQEGWGVGGEVIRRAEPRGVMSSEGLQGILDFGPGGATRGLVVDLPPESTHGLAGAEAQEGP